ncbi:MAG: hypothetical protein QOH13_2166 [Thermoleophilaceae bacterium]|nr:hypothetical protein [Thermoleophilaceae bacterium]
MATRASDDTREQAVARLRSGLASGRVGADTFVERVDRAYAAKTHDELWDLTHDLPAHRVWWQRAVELIAGTHEHTTTPRLRPPPIEPGQSVTVGRSPTCDYVVPSTAASSRHAVLTRSVGGWLLHDLGSRNGTRVNGWLVKEQLLADGDELSFGDAKFVFREP